MVRDGAYKLGKTESDTASRLPFPVPKVEGNVSKSTIIGTMEKVLARRQSDRSAKSILQT